MELLCAGVPTQRCLFVAVHNRTREAPSLFDIEHFRKLLAGRLYARQFHRSQINDPRIAFASVCDGDYLVMGRPSMQRWHHSSRIHIMGEQDRAKLLTF